MQVFISYSTRDRAIVREFAKELKPHAKVWFWDHDKEPGKEAWPSIFAQIDNSDLVLTLVTGKALERAFSVGQEVGHAKSKGKEIVPIVEHGVSFGDLGCLSGLTPIELDRTNLPKTMGEIQTHVRKRAAAKRKTTDDGEALLVVVACIALLVILSKT